MTIGVTGGLALVWHSYLVEWLLLTAAFILPKAIQNWKQRSGRGKAGSIITAGANDDYHPPPALLRLFVQDRALILILGIWHDICTLLWVMGYVGIL